MEGHVDKKQELQILHRQKSAGSQEVKSFPGSLVACPLYQYLLITI